MNRKPTCYYTVYRNVDDTIIAFGTSEECSKILGKVDIHRFLSLAARGKLKNYAVVKEKIK